MVHPCDKPCGNKTASGYCATTACINPQFSNIGTAHYGKGVQKRIVTNADKLRSMSDEELAELFDSWIQDCGCNNVPCHKRCEENHQKWLRGLESVSGCKNNWLDWLRQEASDG